MIFEPTLFVRLFHELGLSEAHSYLNCLLIYGSKKEGNACFEKYENYFSENKSKLAIATACAKRCTRIMSFEALAVETGMRTHEAREMVDSLVKDHIVFILDDFPLKEGEKGMKIYFYHNGLRNWLVDNLQSLDRRTDIGVLWENWVLTQYHLTWPEKKIWFWRNRNNEEIDLIAEDGGQIIAYEAKWNGAKYVRIPNMWKEHYSNDQFRVLNPVSFYEWLI